MEPLIEAVRKYPCLWNTAAIEYRDQELKDAAWAEVVKETELPSVKEVKLKWKKLRDSYRDALKRQNETLAKEGAGGKRACPWKYMALMQFLQPHMSNRKKRASPSPPSAPSAHAPSANGLASSDDEDGERADRLALLERRIDWLCAGAAGAKRERRRECAPPPPPDPLDAFFSSMCQSTKRFPFPAQLKIKRALFGAVLEAEEALVAEQQTYASLWAQRAASTTSEDTAHHAS